MGYSPPFSNQIGGVTVPSNDPTDADFLHAAVAALKPVAAPATATSPGVKDAWAYDATHIYVCIATNVWVRATLATF